MGRSINSRTYEGNGELDKAYTILVQEFEMCATATFSSSLTNFLLGTSIPRTIAAESRKPHNHAILTAMPNNDIEMRFLASGPHQTRPDRHGPV